MTIDNTHTYPSMDSQMPKNRKFLLDVVRSLHTIQDEEGNEMRVYLGIQVLTPSMTVVRFMKNENMPNFVEYPLALHWAEEQAQFLNNFWDVDDDTFAVILSPDVIEVVNTIAMVMSQSNLEELRQKTMLN